VINEALAMISWAQALVLYFSKPDRPRIFKVIIRLIAHES
jgi:hypothetical protein